MHWKWLKPMIGLGAILFSFYLILLSFINIFPKWIAMPLLFLSILFTLTPSFPTRKKFRGF
ncbi:hypothetical protein [Alkalihalobacillus pseudalcaliphilus]|uniref:hypothetical protein n=1 Tax=Alkalihalobacillus pseudalcaliphilus TaxID=79884 RepID=UPI00064D80A3|nr:hypothetical protein [Alkalihalobacillus pseudalcaliphilus]KMK74804.1 hypothetical protein AB990_20200 [Alkalihalobacillus pseudalcaliphilus]